MKKWLVGVDEAGRGPIAGPVAVGVVAIPIVTDRTVSSLFGECRVADSKWMTEREREHTFMTITELAVVRSRVSMVSARVIDRIGITSAVRRGVARALAGLALDPDKCEVRLDGLLRAPAVYCFQQTIIGGDALDPVISLASIAAKVTRDRHMVRLARKFPHYGFERHKGYGTSAHYEALRKHGPCPHHRRTFLRAIV
ncbi:MAG: ribonuclease HII [Candidatus Vogelbacteria bacterium CG10_big_fil_rev_8_21_14_0_10_51_16]|uniref:Ribonuclease n=1 Tax=Candidatus Vogelbacteria bacterium CG10_big_fil_rev_8_21_14_0_10_51_16 TaxID=1975045 RepID=A0A2H0RFY8_9BACT|nr:MAG: ribonuclease HII [Candidatus Vogelbacteria bacterium CG10_big_fil_rev_8_21_14_0_10_51_16]